MPSETVIDLGYRPRPWQAKCHRSKKRFSVRVLHRRAGKTELAIVELVSSALKSSLPLPHFAYIAPFLKQAKGIAWDRLKAYARRVPGTEINEVELWVRFAHNAAKVQLFGGDNPDGLRGLRLDGCVVDEVAQIKPEIWNEIVQPALSDRKGWALFIGTPKGINLFSELFFKAQTTLGWSAEIYTVYDTDALDPEEVERLRRDMPENEFAREYLCDFSAAGENQLLSVAEIEDASRRKVRPDQYSFAPKILGVDVARFGDDKSVIVPRQGLACFEPIVVAGLDNMSFASKVAQKIVDWMPDAVFIDVGAGTGVIDRLRQLGHDVIEVNFGGKASSREYVNKRTEMFWNMAAWVHAGGCLPNHTPLKQDMATPTYSHNAKNQRVLETKDEIKRRLMRSPDLADALALTFAYPVAPTSRTPYGTAKAAVSQFYDPERD